MTDSYRVRTDIGKISIPYNLIRELVLHTAEDREAGVYVANSKGKILKRPGEAQRSIEISLKEGRLCIKLFLVIKFGLSIQHATESIIENIRSGIEDLVGRQPSEIIIVVAGVMSQKFARRDIEIRSEFE